MHPGNSEDPLEALEGLDIENGDCPNAPHDWCYDCARKLEEQVCAGRDKRIAELERLLLAEQKLTGIQYGKVAELEAKLTETEGALARCVAKHAKARAEERERCAQLEVDEPQGVCGECWASGIDTFRKAIRALGDE